VFRSAPVPRPLVRLVVIRYLEESFVLPGSFGIARLSHILPAQNQPVPFALHCDDLAVKRFIEETKPILSRLRCGYLLHAYNVQERLAGSQGECWIRRGILSREGAKGAKFSRIRKRI
jgi:hypothetical protein